MKHREDAIKAKTRASTPKTKTQEAKAAFGLNGKEAAVERRSRQAHVRFIVTEAWVNGRPIRDSLAIRERLLQVSGIEASTAVIDRDLNMLGAIRVVPEGTDKADSFIIIPPYSPDSEALRAAMSADVVAVETDARISAYAVEMYPWKDMVLINTDRNCAQMLADVLVLNPWPEMVHVQAGNHSIIIFCPNEASAERLWLRLNRQHEDLPRYREVQPRVRRKTGSFLDYFRAFELHQEEAGSDGI